MTAVEMAVALVAVRVAVKVGSTVVDASAVACSEAARKVGVTMGAEVRARVARVEAVMVVVQAVVVVVMALVATGEVMATAAMAAEQVEVRRAAAKEVA